MSDDPAAHTIEMLELWRMSCLTIAMQKDGEDRLAWLDDATEHEAAITLIRSLTAEVDRLKAEVQTQRDMGLKVSAHEDRLLLEKIEDVETIRDLRAKLEAKDGK